MLILVKKSYNIGVNRFVYGLLTEDLLHGRTKEYDGRQCRAHAEPAAAYDAKYL